jgi:alpha/beta superfamily hydrolase
VFLSYQIEGAYVSSGRYRRYNRWWLLAARSSAVLCLLLIMTTVSDTKTDVAEKPDIEAAVCGAIREPLMFWFWRSMAGSPSPNRFAHVRDVEPMQFKTRDGIELGGYKLLANNPKGYVLVAQGNAMLADQLVADLAAFRELGLDVYIFDYRGYGISQGKSRLTAIVSDYAEIVSYLNTLRYGKRLLYGISMGGVVLLNAAGRSQVYSRLVVDSSPGRISNYGCPKQYDPVDHLPEDSSRVMIISGEGDAVVSPRQMGELIRVAGSRGARILEDKEFGHPYQDSPKTHQRRQKEVAAFLLQE